MKKIIASAAFLLAFSAQAYAGDTNVSLSIEGKDYEGVIYDNKAAAELLARLPLTLTLNRGGRDFCGDMDPLGYDEKQVQNGYRNGMLAYWTPGQDFVIFLEKEESGASVNGVVPLGEIKGYQPLLRLSGSIHVRISRR